MKSVLWGVPLCMGFLAASSQAQMVYKCVNKGAITYQEEPCEVQAAAKGVSLNTALVGKWTYDHDVTMAWMRQHDKMTKIQEALLNALADHATFVFTPNLMSRDIKAFDVTVDGAVQTHVPATHDDTAYNLVSANPKMVTISAQDPDTISGFTAEFHFEGPDTMWVSLANQRLTVVDNPNSRFYYKRIH